MLNRYPPPPPAHEWSMKKNNIKNTKAIQNGDNTGWGWVRGVNMGYT